MAKRRKQEATSNPVLVTDTGEALVSEPEKTSMEAAPEETAAAPAAAGGGRASLTIKLNPDGSPDFGSMRESTRAKFYEALGKMGPLPGAPARAAAVDLPPAMMVPLIGILGSIETLIATRALGVPAPIARQVVPFSAQETEMLAAPLAAVVSKYIPADVARYQEEVNLALLLVQIHSEKWAMIQQLRAAQKPAALATAADQN